MIKKEIHLEKAGTLHKFLSSYEKDNVTHLVLSGLINSKDFAVLDDMCSSNGEYVGEIPYDEFVIDDNEPPYLAYLDMGNCKIEGDAIVPCFTFYSKLVEVILPNNAIQISDDSDPAFEGSQRLKKVIFPDSLKKIGFLSFANCDLQEIKLPENLEVMGSSAFAGNIHLKSVKLPQILSVFGGCSFSGCDIEKFDLDENNQHFTIIDGVVFSKDKTKLIAYPCGCKKEHYAIPEGVKIICNSAFSDAKIKSITIPDTLECIEESAFISSNLEKINIPNSVTTLEKSIFRWCYSLKQIKLPDTISILKEDSFVWCNSLKEIEIPASVKIIEQDALCSAHNLKKVILHDGLEEINDDLKFTKVGKVNIPKTVKKILSGTALLAQRYKIQFDVDVNNPYLCSIDGSLYSKDKTVLISAYRKDSKKFTVINGVKKIADYVFSNTKVENVLLPETLETIGHRCFDNCKNIKEICLPKSIKKIDFQAFNHSEKLEKMILCAEQPPEITNPSADCWKFMGDSKKLILYVPNESIKLYKTTKYWKDIKHIQVLN